MLDFINYDFFNDMIRSWLFFASLYYIGISLTYITLLILSLKIIIKSKKIRKKNKEKEKEKNSKVDLNSLPGISIIVPAYNEEVTIFDSVSNMLTLNYSNYEIIIINDGSKDKTLQVLKNKFDLISSTMNYDKNNILLRNITIVGTYRSQKYPNVYVIDKENGGKASALNTGIYFSKYNYFCAIDADTIIMKDALVKASKPFIEDPKTIAVGGILRVGNGQIDSKGNVLDKNMNFDLLPLLQTIEYERDFKLGRLGWYALKATILVSGAFGVFNKKAVEAVGGYNDASVGEDLELLMRMHNIFGKSKDKYRIVFLPEETCWTEAPSSYSILYNQRNRWHRGLMDSFSINRDILLNPDYGFVGMVSVPYYFFVEVYGPLIKFINYFILLFALLTKIISLNIFIPIIIISFLFRIIMNLSTILLDNLYFNEKPKIGNFIYLAIASIIDGIGYKQFISIATLFGFKDYFKKKKGWGKMERKGIKD